MVEVDARLAADVAAAMGPEGDLVAERLARGCRCFVVMVEGAVAGYGWLSTGPEWVGEIQVVITPGAGEAYIWNCVTLPGRRRQGVFRSLVAGIAAIAAREGVNRLWIGSVENPAERAMTPLGFAPAARFDSFEFLGSHWLRVSHECEVLSVGRGWHVRRAKRRRH